MSPKLLYALSLLAATTGFTIQMPSVSRYHPSAKTLYPTPTTSREFLQGLRLSGDNNDNEVPPPQLSSALESTPETEISESTSLINGEKESEVKPEKRWWSRGKTDDDGLTFRQQLAKAGLSVVLSYGAVSNFSYGISMSVAWYLFSRKTGLSPLAPGQWKPFLAVYSAFFVFNNIVRPVRFAASVAVSPYFDRLINWVQKRTSLPRGWSIGLCVVVVNVIGTCGLMAAGITIASAAAGVPPFVIAQR